MPSLYQDVLSLGIEHSNHESDLYLPNTSEVIALLKKHGQISTVFKSNIDGKIWRDVPFKFEPYWQKRGM